MKHIDLILHSAGQLCTLAGAPGPQRGGELGRLHIIENGAVVNARNKYGVTPLHEAAGGGYTEVAQFLISNGAEVNAKDVNGDRPRKWARRNGHKKLAALLKEHGGR